MIYWKKVEEKVAAALEQLRSMPDRGGCVATLVHLTDYPDVGRLDLEIRVTKLVPCWFWKVNLVAIWGGLGIEVHYPLIAYEEPKTKVVLDTSWVLQQLRAWLRRHLNDLGKPVKPGVSRRGLKAFRKMIEVALTHLLPT